MTTTHQVIATCARVCGVEDIRRRTRDWPHLDARLIVTRILHDRGVPRQRIGWFTGRCRSSTSQSLRTAGDLIRHNPVFAAKYAACLEALGDERPAAPRESPAIHRHELAYAMREVLPCS